MQLQDNDRLKLQELAATVKAWSGFVADVARVDVEEHGSAWRIALAPFVAGACPLVILLDADGRKCDLRIGRETYRGWALSSLDLILPLMEAVSEGRVATSHEASAATGLSRGVRTQVLLGDGRVIELVDIGGRVAGAAIGEGGLVGRATHYLPYRRPGRTR